MSGQESRRPLVAAAKVIVLSVLVTSLLFLGVKVWAILVPCVLLAYGAACKLRERRRERRSERELERVLEDVGRVRGER